VIVPMLFVETVKFVTVAWVLVAASVLVYPQTLLAAAALETIISS